MGTKKFTFLELHLDGDTQFGPKQLGEALPGILVSGSDTDEESIELEEQADEETEAEDSSGGKPIAVLLGLVVLVGIGLFAKRRRGGSSEEPEVPEEADVIVN